MEHAVLPQSGKTPDCLIVACINASKFSYTSSFIPAPPIQPIADIAADAGSMDVTLMHLE